MTQMDFLSYQEVKGQKFLGIASVCYNGVMLRYKIVMTKDGSGYFPASASYNVGENGQERYVTAFCLDSNMQNELLKELIMKNVGDYYHKIQSQVAAMDHLEVAQPKFQPRDKVNVNQPVSAFQTTFLTEEECTPF